MNIEKFPNVMGMQRYLRAKGAKLVRAKPIMEDNGEVSYLCMYVDGPSEAAVRYAEKRAGGRRRA